MRVTSVIAAALFGAFFVPAISADENLLGYVKGAETLPKGAFEIDQTITYRTDKGTGDYDAWNLSTEFEYGFSDRFTGSAYVKFQAIDTSGLVIDGYLPGDKDYGPKPSGIELSAKYNYLSPARDDFGLTGYYAFSYDWLDMHSGQDKDKLSVEGWLIAQKYFMEGQLVWLANLGLEATHADRGNLDNLPPGFDWPTKPEMEIELLAGTGLTYRIAPGLYIGAEVMYETEYETEVGQERWTWFAGPTVHYGSERWWATFTWFPQIAGGGEMYPGQPDTDLHLIEKTEHEFRLKLGFNF